MTLSKKYNEIMDRVVVTDEMRERLQERIERADVDRLADSLKNDEDGDFANAFSGKKRYPVSKILGGLAAACVILLLIGTLTVRMPSEKMDTAGGTVHEETMEAAAEDVPYEENSADITVGAQDIATPEDADQGTEAPEAADQDTGAMRKAEQDAAPLKAGDMSPAERRKAIEAYIGPDYRITDELIAEDVIVYAISGTEIGNVISYIRINVQNDSAEIEKIQTNEITNLSFRELMERQVSFRDLMEK